MVKIIAQIPLIVAVFYFVGSCRTVASNSRATTSNSSSEAFCIPAAEKALTCQVRDIVPRLGSRLEQVKKSDFAKVSQVNIVVFPDESRKQAQVDFLGRAEPAQMFRFDRVTDLYQRNGCLAELTGGVFSDGFTPRVSLKLLISSANSDHAAVAEVSDFRFSIPLHLSLDLHCERKLN